MLDFFKISNQNKKPGWCKQINVSRGEQQNLHGRLSVHQCCLT